MYSLIRLEGTMSSQVRSTYFIGAMLIGFAFCMIDYSISPALATVDVCLLVAAYVAAPHVMAWIFGEAIRNYTGINLREWIERYHRTVFFGLIVGVATAVLLIVATTS